MPLPRQKRISQAVPVSVTVVPTSPKPKVVVPVPKRPVRRKQLTAATGPTPPTSPSPRRSVSDWPEHQRRRLMWLTVAAVSVLLVVGWVAILPRELRHRAAGPIFGDIAKFFGGFRATTTPSPQQQEIRRLNEQVFPQFQP